MPIDYHVLKAQCELAIWKTTETHEYFYEHLRERNFPTEGADAISHPDKRLQWLASRFLLTELYPEGIARLEDRKTSLRNGPHISLSHCGLWAGVLLCSRNCGLDIQVPHEKLIRVAHKFANPGEADLLKQPSHINNLCALWCIKEAVFKAYQTSLPFKEIRLMGFDESVNEAAVCVSRKGLMHEHKVGIYQHNQLTIACMTD